MSGQPSALSTVVVGRTDVCDTQNSDGIVKWANSVRAAFAGSWICWSGENFNDKMKWSLGGVWNFLGQYPQCLWGWQGWCSMAFWEGRSLQPVSPNVETLRQAQVDRFWRCLLWLKRLWQLPQLVQYLDRTWSSWFLFDEQWPSCWLSSRKISGPSENLQGNVLTELCLRPFSVAIQPAFLCTWFSLVQMDVLERKCETEGWNWQGKACLFTMPVHSLHCKDCVKCARDEKSRLKISSHFIVLSPTQQEEIWSGVCTAFEANENHFEAMEQCTWVPQSSRSNWSVLG